MCGGGKWCLQKTSQNISFARARRAGSLAFARQSATSLSPWRTPSLSSVCPRFALLSRVRRVASLETLLARMHAILCSRCGGAWVLYKIIIIDLFVCTVKRKNGKSCSFVRVLLYYYLCAVCVYMYINAAAGEWNKIERVRNLSGSKWNEK